MVGSILLLSHLFVQHDNIFEHVPELLASFLIIALLLLPQGFGLYRGELMKISKDNDNMKTTRERDCNTRADKKFAVTVNHSVRCEPHTAELIFRGLSDSWPTNLA